jgi:hypothetical protein
MSQLLLLLRLALVAVGEMVPRAQLGQKVEQGHAVQQRQYPQ